MYIIIALLAAAFQLCSMWLRYVELPKNYQKDGKFQETASGLLGFIIACSIISNALWVWTAVQAVLTYLPAIIINAVRV